MIVCHCGVVSDRDVSASIASGARTLPEICRATGAGRGCGGCVFSVRQLLCQHEAVEVTPAMEVASAAS
jgi:bacterioferritin-associated ferredoxin